MVTVAVLVILATVAVPGLQAFATRSGMNAIRDDFSIALQRARLDAISRNTCVSICQLEAGTSDTCQAKPTESWAGGWIVFANQACTAALPDEALPRASIVAVRQASDPRFQLIQENPTGIVTFDPRGTQLSQNFSGVTQDAQDEDSAHARAITVSRQGRVSVALKD